MDSRARAALTTAWIAERGRRLELLRAALLGRALLGEEDGVDVGEHAALRDGHAGEELVELLVVAHREGDVARHDARLLVVARGVAGELEHLRTERGGWSEGRARERVRALIPSERAAATRAARLARARTSAARYSRTAAMYTGAPAPMRCA